MLIYIIILSILIILTIFLSVKYPHFIKKIDNSLLVALVIATFTLFFTPYVNKEFEKKVVPLTIYSEKDIEDALKNWEKTKRTNNAQQFCTPRK